MALTKEEVLKIAKLSMLEFNESEIVVLQKELNDILEFVSKLEEANVEGIEAMTQVNKKNNEFREDIVMESVIVGEAIKNAPESVDGTFIVPRTVGEN